MSRARSEGPGAVSAGPVRVVPYDRDWPDRFAEERAHLTDLLGRASSAIHHVGSTSVPGLAAKPVIDILIETPDLSSIDDRTRDLTGRGYIAKGEHGISGRRYFSRPADETTPKVHLHVFEEGRDEALLHLRLRDHLRAHPAEARRYGAFKMKLAERYGEDRAAYQAAKAPFIEGLLQRISS